MVNVEHDVIELEVFPVEEELDKRLDVIIFGYDMDGQTSEYDHRLTFTWFLLH